MDGNSVWIGAAAGGIVIALGLIAHWLVRKVYPKAPWRLSVGIMVAVVFALVFLIPSIS